MMGLMELSGKAGQDNFESIRRALVHVSPSWDPGATCLGIICGEFIFTCAHIAGDRPILGAFADVPLYEVTRIHDGADGTFAEYVATTTDFMVLGPDGVGVGLSEYDGPTQSCFNVLQDEDWDFNELHPSELVCSEAEGGAVELPGFFFSPDGAEVHEVTFEIRQNYPLIQFASDDVLPGCSGGPLFTRDLHLIGVCTNGSNFSIGSKSKGCLGRRIDLCSPVFVHRQVSWRKLQI
jgi:hypothetical protein